MENIKSNTFITFQEDDPKSGQASFLPINAKSWSPLTGTSKVIQNKRSSDSQFPTDHFKGRLFKFFKPFQNVDQKQLLYESLNTNMRRIADSLTSIAESLHTLSTSWKFEFSEVILMDIINALNKIAENLNITGLFGK
ncbi:UNVERIFIED_CONTAM: hypothetical protein RMT77_006435 [Armadillidium vulgare]